VLWPFAEIM